MNNLIDIFAELGQRLRNFGHDEHSQRVLTDAIALNEWFTQKEVYRAIDAICEEFLDRKKLIAWLKEYPQTTPQRNVAIIMAGNIPLVGFFDLMCVLVCGHRAYIKPSSKDRILTGYITELLRDIHPTIPIHNYDDSLTYDAIIATGGDEAARYFKQKYNNIPTIIRGSRHSLAILDGNESKRELEGLCEDIVSYNGLGCRNVSLLMVHRKIPTIPLFTPSDMHRQNYAHTKAMRTMLGQEFMDYGCYIFVKESTFPDSISQINVIQYDSIAQVKEWLKENDEKIQCIVSNIIDHPRRVDFGRAQYPTLTDYADGVDVMKFLTSI